MDMKKDGHMLDGKCDVCGGDVDAYCDDFDCTCQTCGITYIPANSSQTLWIQDYAI